MHEFFLLNVVDRVPATGNVTTSYLWTVVCGVWTADLNEKSFRFLPSIIGGHTQSHIMAGTFAADTPKSCIYKPTVALAYRSSSVGLPYAGACCMQHQHQEELPVQFVALLV